MIAADQFQPSEETVVVAFLALVFGLFLVIAVPVVLARWVFRVNEMVTYQRQIVEQLIGLRSDLRAMGKD